MADRPILFSGPMVRALLEGRKTQTRRAIKFKPWHQIDERDDGSPWPWMYDDENSADYWVPCPYGQPGDLLWVREAWRVAQCYDVNSGSQLSGILSARNVQYEMAADQFLGVVSGRYRHARFMPRWASRLTLRITDVRVERLQGISESDSLAEGITKPVGSQFWHADPRGSSLPGDTPQWAYRNLWEQINGPGSWDANPWVWALTFDVIPRNVGDVLTAPEVKP